MNSKNYLNILNGATNILFFMILLVLTNDAGAGIFLTCFFVYKVLYAILVGGIRLNVAKNVAARRNRGMQDNAKMIFRFNLLFCIVAGSVVGLVLWLFGNKISMLLVGSEILGSVFALFGLYFLLHSICDCTCGYLLGCNNGTLVFIGESVFGIISVILCPIFIKLSTGYGQKVSNLLKAPIMVNCFKVMGAVGALCAASLVMLVVIILGARGKIKRSKGYAGDMSMENKRNLFYSNITGVVDSLKFGVYPILIYMIIYIMVARGLIGQFDNLSIYFSKIGSFGSKIYLLIYLQDTLFGEYVNSIRSRIKQVYRKDEIKNLSALVNGLCKSSLFTVIPVACSVITLSQGIASCVFVSTDEAGKIITILAGVAIIFAGIDKTFKAILGGINHSEGIWIGNIAGLISVIVYLVIAGKNGMNVNLGCYGIILYFIIISFAHGFFVIRNIGLRYNELIGKLASVAVAGLLLIIVDLILARFLNMNLLILTLSYICGYAIYIVGLVALRGISHKEIMFLKGTLLYFPFNFIAGIFGVR